MPPRRYEFYREKIRFRESEKRRPWVVLTDPAPLYNDPSVIAVQAAPVSTSFDLMDDRGDFPIYHTDPAFSDTGLDRDCYVIWKYQIFIPVALLQHKIGDLTGELLDDFKVWAER